jgi:xanthine dehydrogenase accessory factor
MMDPIFAVIEQWKRAGQEGVFVLVTHVDGHAPQGVGAKMLVLPDGTIQGTIGGGKVEHVVIDAALEALKAKEIRTETYQLKADLGMCCGGQMQVYMEPVIPVARLILFGAGHVAQPTASLAAQCGFEVHVVDERPDWNNTRRFPLGHTLHVVPHADYLLQEAFRSSDSIVILTHNHDHDREILRDALSTHKGYVGMIGSTRKVQKTLRQLALEGVDELDLERANAPIGLDIHAETPQEIAVSIVGELIRSKRMESSQKTTRGAPVSLLADSQPSLHPAETTIELAEEAQPKNQGTPSQK